MESLFQHFRQEEKEKIIFYYSKFEIASRDYYPVLLDFTDPRERKIIESISGRFPDIKIEYYGGGSEDNHERKRVLLVPEMLEVSRDDFEIETVELHYPEKFVTLTHRNILGAMMNVGVDRSKLGDIILSDHIQFAIDKNFFDLFTSELTTIKNAPIELVKIPNDEFLSAVSNTTKHSIIVSSFRLDVIVSEVLKEGRAKSKNRITREKVKVNHALVTDPSFQVELEDVISVRGFGRFIVSEFIHETRKGKSRIEVLVYED
ncbi:RNA-binding protein [Nosocomiicoccus massiliensis]|uniref:YlmH family RNA-binding protein n=1 Tax=Nosocomiicoccus massiliensis TaxID=1232430 RepID=UPI00041BC630|nr:YlmH/Sll1252 family protein [Nosocomiicoccus massiliensis]